MICAVLVAALGYLDLAEIAVGAYDDARMEAYVREAETVGVQEHGFPRLAANLAVLVARGRLPEKKPLLARMMTAACRGARKGRMPPKSGGNEFSVRELVSAVLALEKVGAFPSETTAGWKADLAAVEANRCYQSPEWYKLGDSVGHNWPLFGAASEQARLRNGLGGDAKFIEDWVADQLRHFDAKGMYRDPHEPAVYDFIGRLCYMQILHFGYDGPCRAKIEEELTASAEPTLAMLSACGEIPFGGRSNQFLHNNTLYAAVAEWYAAFFAKRGDAETAARFRSAAARAVAALEPWVENGRVFHVKNRFPKPETKGARNIDQKWFGCENYAYFDKYMITMGSWAVLADEFAGGQPLPAVGDDPLVSLDFSTTEHFHWRFVQSRNYTVQEDWNANASYDATGVGRIHRRGAPPSICLSAPCAEKPSYDIGVEKNPGPLAIAAIGGELSYEVADHGVTLVASAGRLTLPVFEFDGETETRVTLGERMVEIRYRGWICRYAACGGEFADTGRVYFNRNGRYRRIDCEVLGAGPAKVFVSIEREERGACVCGVAPERENDFAWENDKFGMRAYGPGEFHKWSGFDVFNKGRNAGSALDMLRRPGQCGDWHAKPWRGVLDNYTMGASRGVGGVALFADGEWKTYPDWETSRVIHEGDDYLEFELVYPAFSAAGKMTCHITLRRGERFFRNDVSFERDFPAGFIAGPGLDLEPKRDHKGDIFEDAQTGVVSLFEDAKGANGSTMEAIFPIPGQAFELMTDHMNCRVIGFRTRRFSYYAGATWSLAGEITSAEAWHAHVRETQQRTGAADSLALWPAGLEPRTISRRITEQFLSADPLAYKPRGTDIVQHFPTGYGWGNSIFYATVSLWATAFDNARQFGEGELERQLVDRFRPILEVRPEVLRPQYHVDYNVVGAVPLAYARLTGDGKAREVGLALADYQWSEPRKDAPVINGNPQYDEAMRLWKDGYTGETRLWIDDMYMINLLQTEAYRLTGDRKYVDRAAKEMCLYLDRLQLANGLFYHAPDVPFVWGRGAGWMAAGMPLVLKRLDGDHPCYAKILAGYRKMMAKLLDCQRADGLWGQLVDDPTTWAETSGSAMFAYGLAEGVVNGWLDGSSAASAVRRAYLALCGRMDEYANVADVCIGTNKKSDRAYYLARERVNGDPHGQAAMLWLAGALGRVGQAEKMKTPMTSRQFQKRVDPVSGVVSYALSGGEGENRQSMYFTAKSMTEDGRFLVFDRSDNERLNPNEDFMSRRKAVVDFLKDEIFDLPGANGNVPFIDVKDDTLVTADEKGFVKYDLREPSKPVRLCGFPEELLKLGKPQFWFTHLTLTGDRRKAFLDACLVAPGSTNYVQGLIELATGSFERWGRTDFYCNHGQLNPARDDLALCAWEECWTGEGAKFWKKVGYCPRLWLVRPGREYELVEPIEGKDQNTTHEVWDDDGQGFCWCRPGVCHYDLATGQKEVWCPDRRAIHNRITCDKRYIVYDHFADPYWRGCSWGVKFYDRQTRKTTEVYSLREPLNPRERPSKLHPDPHPQFVCGDRYIVSTANNAAGNMEVYVTPVNQLKERK